MPHPAADRTRALSGPFSLFFLSTTMAAIVATGVAVTLHAAFDEERQHSVVCACACDPGGSSDAPPADADLPTAETEIPAPEGALEHAEASREIPLETKVEGALDRGIIRRVVRAHIAEIRHCYNEGLVQNPELGGRVVVFFTIDERGNVSDSTITDSTLPDADVGTCIAGAAKRWIFPKPDGGTVQVTYPFDLSPG